MNFRITCTTIMALAAAPVFAQTGCVTASGLQSGIHLDYADGTTETYRQTGPATMSVDGYDAGEPYFRLELAHGTHLLEYAAITDGQVDESSRQVYDYGVDPAQLPVPSPGGRFNADVTVTASDGPRSEGQLQAYVEGEPLVVEGCTYAAIDVLIAYDTQDNYMESIRYLPDLGLGYLLWNQSDEGQSDENVVTRIRTGK